MTLAILTTGDEIIHGDTLNTNGPYIAKALSADGVPLGLQMTCSDKEADLLESIAFLAPRHSIMISIGGLGPTSDDRTRFAFARYFGIDLVVFEDALTHIAARLTRANLPLDEGNRLQALFPTGATLLPNPHGTAMGCVFSVADKIIILLPGPPHECLPMFDHHVLPLLQKTQHSQKHILSWQLFGVAEGQISAMLEGALQAIPCNFGYRLDTPYLEFKVRCQKHDAAQVAHIVNPLVAPLIISPPKQKATGLLRAQLQSGPEVVILDSATGGVLETLLCVPDNQHNVHFSSKPNARICFEITGLQAYWEGPHDATEAEVVLKYQCLQQVGFEVHRIPYRGHSLILHYAAEFLSFRMLQRLNEIH